MSSFMEVAVGLFSPDPRYFYSTIEPSPPPGYEWYRTVGLHIPVLYPTLTPLHCDPLQYPKTPKLTLRNEAKGMALTIGVEMTERSRSTKAAKSRIASGVAARSMMNL